MKKIKRVEQKPLRVVWRGNKEELDLFVSDLGFGCSTVRRVGSDFKLLTVWPKNSDRSLSIVLEWLKANGDLVPPDANIRMSFSRPDPKAKKLRVDESPPPPDGLIERLEKEWKFFRKYKKCPRCKARTIGVRDVYDDTCTRMRLYACVCGQQIYPGGGTHLAETMKRMKTPTKGHTHRRRAPVSV